MKTLVFLAAVSLVCGGCASHYRDATLYHSSGSAKPIVAVLPVIDSTSGNRAHWDLSEELTERIKSRIFDSSKLYLLKDKGDVEIAHLLNVPDPQAIPETVGNSLGAAEFAIVTELLEQNEEVIAHPRATNERTYLNEIAGKMHLAMRIRVVDLRKDKPRVILQEVVMENYDISRPYLNVDYKKSPWGEEAFERTPMGMAHSKIIREVVAHAEGYIGAHRG